MYYPIEFSNHGTAIVTSLVMPSENGAITYRIENWSTEDQRKDYFRCRAMSSSDFHTTNSTILFISLGY